MECCDTCSRYDHCPQADECCPKCESYDDCMYGEESVKEDLDEDEDEWE
ncbi:MAG: hypothetical protein AB1498_04010 [bacterium]